MSPCSEPDVQGRRRVLKRQDEPADVHRHRVAILDGAQRRDPVAHVLKHPLHRGDVVPGRRCAAEHRSKIVHQLADDPEQAVQPRTGERRHVQEQVQHLGVAHVGGAEARHGPGLRGGRVVVASAPADGGDECPFEHPPRGRKFVEQPRLIRPREEREPAGEAEPDHGRDFEARVAPRPAHRGDDAAEDGGSAPIFCTANRRKRRRVLRERLGVEEVLVRGSREREVRAEHGVRGVAEQPAPQVIAGRLAAQIEYAGGGATRRDRRVAQEARAPRIGRRAAARLRRPGQQRADMRQRGGLRQRAPVFVETSDHGGQHGRRRGDAPVVNRRREGGECPLLERGVL